MSSSSSCNLQEKNPYIFNSTATHTADPHMEDEIEKVRVLLIKQFEEYEKSSEGMSTINDLPPLKPVQGFVRHGTICVSIINRVGLLFAGDGLARKFDPDNPRDDEVTSQTSTKVFYIGNRMLISVAGNSVWSDYIWELLIPEIEDEDPVKIAQWTCEYCARFVRYVLGRDRNLLEERNGMRPGALVGKTCSMMFGAYEQNEPKLFFGSDRVQEIFEANVFFEDEEKNKSQLQLFSWYSMGSGTNIADSVILGDHDVRITREDLSHLEEQLVLLLSAMKATIDGHKDTGGVVKVYYMPPPPGVAHMVYDEFHRHIPLDIIMLRANMYQRLFEAAREVGSYMEDEYLEKFIEFSNQYEDKLEELMGNGQDKVDKYDKQLEKLQRRKEKLRRQYLGWLNLQRRRRRKFKWHKVYSSV